MFGRNRPAASPGEPVSRLDRRSSSDRTLTGEFVPTKAQIKRATRARLYWSLFAAFCLLVSVVFLILVEIGNTHTDATLNKIYFININLSNIIPLSVPDATLINSIAQTLGLHDFYTVGLWNFCEGYNGQGTTDCSTPRALYWFDPVKIITNELLAGATIALPSEITKVLGLIRTVSHWMFGLFMTGICLNFVMIFIVPIAVFTRWATLFIMILTFFGALCTTVATVVATVMFIIMKNAMTSVTQLNIEASLGIRMFVFMWIASGFAIIAWLITLCLTCCCASRRDVRRGKKRGDRKAWRTGTSEMSEKK